MRKLRFLLAGAALGAVFIRMTGFPARIGLTQSQAAVSLPGDLLSPSADVVVDRAVLIHASPERVWEVIDAAFHAEEKDVLVKELCDCMVLRAAYPTQEPDSPVQGTCALVLLPEANGTTRVHMRERHTSSPEMSARKIRALLALESPVALRMLYDIKHVAEMN
ncbi:hypothetical protein [Schaalia sp. lx-260]|uniref:hypothetical protein n=1 Tax=Schaalia sp. lx-260 TaxID=2899082 RepID=UPI001E2D1B2F|nr:hypothetical protein [Schaalia sp. lx-260]MCD4549329.1 hypothetical protein [Schaalia sp. lx-260]